MKNAGPQAGQIKMALPFMKAEPWLRSLTGEVDLHRISTPIRVTHEATIEVSHRINGREKKLACRQFDFTFMFRGTDGKDLQGSARVFIPVRRPREHMPMIVSMHYEIDANGSARFLAKGWTIMTPHGERSYTAANLVGHGLNHSVAMAQLPRRFPFVNQKHVILFGGSAGGYHALMATSKIFPVTAVCAAVPPLNLKYNINYLVRNEPFNHDPTDPKKHPAPVVNAVTPIAVETAKAGRPELQDWSSFSPVFQTRLITFPVLIWYSTADALVPITQLCKDLVRKPPPGLWPKGFSFDMSRILPKKRERARFLDFLQPNEYCLMVAKVPPDSPTIEKKKEELSAEEVSKIRSTRIRWSKRRRFSIFVLDEGYPEPLCGHVKYHHQLRDDDFFDYHMSRPSFRPEILTEEKLVQLMQRFSGKEPYQGKEYEGDRSWPISRLDHQHIERWNVATGLEIYVGQSPRNLSRLLSLYEKLPPELRVLDLDSIGFQECPMQALTRHQALALEECGDLELAGRLKRRIGLS